MKSNYHRFGMLSSIVLCLLLMTTVFLLGADLHYVIQQAEGTIDSTMTGIANELAKEELRKIARSEERDEEKIRKIRERFLKSSASITEAVDITEENATTELIDMSGLKWRIHSMEIIWKIDSSEEIVLNEDTVEKFAVDWQSTDTTTDGHESSTDWGINGNASINASFPPFIFTAKAGLEALGKVSWNSKSSDLWSMKSQLTLTKGYDRLAKRIRSAKVSDCRLSFSISFKNNGDKVLEFDAGRVRFPVYAEATHMVSATPVEEGILRIPEMSVKTFEFQGKLDNSKSLRLLEFMKGGTPDVRIWEGQFTIQSTDHSVKDAILDARKNRTAPITCVLGDKLRFWNIKLSHGGRHVTLEQAMWAVNGIYERAPFGFENGECVSVMGCATAGNGCTFSRYPVLKHNGECLAGRLTKEQLGQRLGEDGVSFHIVDFTDRKSREQVLCGDRIQMFIKEAVWLANEGDAPAQFFCGLINYTPKHYDEAVKWYRKAAEQGLAVAQLNLGFIYDNGHGVPKDEKTAAEWYRKAAEQGLANAQFNLGVMHAKGEGVPKDDEEAVKWYKKAAEQGHAKAQVNLGVMYHNGEGVSKDDEEAVKWHRKAAEQGFAMAQNNIAQMYRYGKGVPQDYEEAVKWCRKAAEQGLAVAQFNLGVMYNNGEGVSKDNEEAVKWYRKAAEQGLGMAQNNIAQMFRYGKGVPKDDEEAVKWCRKAAEQGLAVAQFNLGVMYHNGEGVSKDDEEAVKWCRKAAEQGLAVAQFNLGVMYNNAEGVSKDDEEAVKWYRKAAEHGDANAQFNLGVMYDNGEGVPRNRSEAVKWYKKSAEQGLEEAKKRLKELGE